MDGFTIWRICPSCNGTKIKKIPIQDGEGYQFQEIPCTECNEKGLRFFGYGYEKSFDELPPEPS